MLEQVSSEVDKEFNPDPEPVDFNSVTHKDFDVPGFVSVKPSPTAVSIYSLTSKYFLNANWLEASEAVWAYVYV